MLFTVVGFKKVVSKKDGRLFFELHLTSSDRFVEGVRCDSIFVAAENFSGFDRLSLGASVNVLYNRYGRVDSVSIV